MTTYTILDDQGAPLASVRGDRVAVQAVVVVSPQEGRWTAQQAARIADAFKSYGVYAVVLGTPVNVCQVFQPEE